MTLLSWSRVSNKPHKCAEFAACHDNFAWRKHHSSRFGQLKKSPKGCASDSLSRAFSSDKDSILLLFTTGNRALDNNPHYGQPRFAAVWYDGEDWAILCRSQEAVLIPSLHIEGYKRQEAGAPERLQFLQRLWDAADPSLVVPLSRVAALIS